MTPAVFLNVLLNLQNNVISFEIEKKSNIAINTKGIYEILRKKFNKLRKIAKISINITMTLC